MTSLKPTATMMTSWMIVLLFLSSAYAGHLHILYNINEGANLGFVVGNLTEDLMQDPIFRDSYDLSELSRINFRTLSNSKVNITLREGTGILYVNGEIDREYLCPTSDFCEITIDIYVSLNAKFNILKVTFYINDKNDNSPIFTQREFHKTLPENTPVDTNITLPYAEDDDSSKYSVKEYQLRHDHSTDYFTLMVINNSDGSKDVLMRLIRALDYEVTTSINLTLIAYDGGDPPKSGSLNICIKVADANDHIPSFESKLYSVGTPENIAIGSSLLQVRAIDADSGLNSQIIYSLSPRTQAQYGGLFSIDATTGDVTVVGVLDYETHHVIDLSVVGQDSGVVNSHSADTTISITITDQNDCPPKMSITTLNVDQSPDDWSAVVAEESQAGTFVALLTVTDDDSLPYATVSCELLSADFALQIVVDNTQNKEYQIVTSRVFDREVRTYYDAELRCQDTPLFDPNYSTRTLRVDIEDINDHVPEFSKSQYVTSVRENNHSGQTIITLNATDADSGDNSRLSFRIDTSMSGVFEIDPTRGTVTAVRALDRERNDRYEFSVEVADHGDPVRSTTCYVIVNVIDVNDEPPVFAQGVYYYNITENSRAVVTLGAVEASDLDNSPFNEIQYRFRDESTLNFAIDTFTGEIKTSRALDRETTAQFRLTVVAENPATTTSAAVGGRSNQADDTSSNPILSSSCVVVVTVLDLNDNTPQFIFPSRHNNTIQIATKLPHGYAITRLIAQDADSGRNAQLVYTIQSSSGAGDLFEIGNSSGVIMSKRKLELVDKSRYTLRVQARDSGEPTSRYNDTTLYVVVNKSLLVKTVMESPARGGAILGGSYLHIIIIVSSTLACVIVILIISIICMYCHKDSEQDVTHTDEYDQFKRRDDTLETFHDVSGTQFDTLQPRHRTLSLELDGPGLNMHTLDPYSVEDDSGYQLDDMEYHHHHHAQRYVSPRHGEREVMCARDAIHKPPASTPSHGHVNSPFRPNSEPKKVRLHFMHFVLVQLDIQWL